MAKESMKAREVKRAKLVARYAEKRAALKRSSLLLRIPQRHTRQLVSFRLFPRTPTLSVFTIAARLQAVPKDISVSSACLVSSSVRWLRQV